MVKRTCMYCLCRGRSMRRSVVPGQWYCRDRGKCNQRVDQALQDAKKKE